MLRFFPGSAKEETSKFWQFIHRFNDALQSKQILTGLILSGVAVLGAIALLSYGIISNLKLDRYANLEQKVIIINLLTGFLILLLFIFLILFLGQLQLNAKNRAEIEKQKLINQLSDRIRESLELNTILQTTVAEIANLLALDKVSFNWYYPDKKMLELASEYSQQEQPLPLQCFNITNFGDLNNYFSKKEKVILENISQQSNLPKDVKQAYLDIKAESYLALPVPNEDDFLGYIICTSSKARIWTESEIQLLEEIIDQLAITIKQARLYEQTKIEANLAKQEYHQLQHNLQELRAVQTQLIQTEKMSSLAQLVAGVAHEINNPVNFIYGNLSHTNEYIENLLSLIDIYQQEYPQPTAEVEAKLKDIELDFLIEDLPKVLSSMQVGADRICEIVHSLRNFSRLDESDMKPVNIHDGIDSTLLILQHRLKAKPELPGIQIIKKYGSLSQVECYAGQLNQVFFNILNNAIDALEEHNKERSPEEIRKQPSTITIHTQIKNTLGGMVTIDQSDAPTAYPLVLIPLVVISIKDNGTGMTPEVKKRIFDPFFTTKPVGKGTGLGLSISYQIVVDKHGGELKCISQPGKGAEFLIEIPVKQSLRQYISQ